MTVSLSFLVFFSCLFVLSFFSSLHLLARKSAPENSVSKNSSIQPAMVKSRVEDGWPIHQTDVPSMQMQTTLHLYITYIPTYPHYR
ncbi:hypothetical protein LZ30DRAFT_718025 [Colletotrichum cereale]|nr:hypothetical protein LZ30DRAFT_718025 [Colletotrichum cereale]